ncbi:MAG: DUF3365 domain-containing protein [Coriobacteriales bacterium]|jgi:signal transduction histidine kinase|nr:DUF3365 domain-containing protein [Coriobacteriales bacterium]
MFSNRHMQLWVRFIILVAISSALVFGVYLARSYFTQRAETEKQAIAEARVLNAEIDATWDYINSIQNNINYSNGRYDFKNVYCATAGKSIASRFTNRTDYTIRYVRESPRVGPDVPDEFEKRALDVFRAGTSSEHYEMADYNGVPSLRYATVLTIKANCLECHGEPSGEKDVTGFIKEGMSLGDVAGAVSIVIPLTEHIRESNNDLLGTVVFFCVLMIIVTGVLGVGLYRWVTHPIVSENVWLRDTNEAQSNFLTIISHELKTPLSSIIAFTDLWKKKARDKDEEESELVDEIGNNSQALLGMVNNMLDTARLEAGLFTFQPEDLDVYDLIPPIKAVAGPLAYKKNITFRTSVASNIPIVKADREVLRRIILNLVSNALRFTDEGGEIALRIDCKRGSLIIQVRDTGTGIPEEEQEHIFERFVSKRGSEQSGAGGTGLGLSLVKGLSEMMGGTVALQSRVGKGSAFTVSLPVEILETESGYDE